MAGVELILRYTDVGEEVVCEGVRDVASFKLRMESKVSNRNPWRDTSFGSIERKLRTGQELT